tara:strand:- start:1136 stop:3823 length:2688 start_codon:yes stop_codon:yes gene_type:complete
MVYLLKDLKFNKNLFKVNKEKSISNLNLFTTELKNFYEIKNKKLLENFKKKNNGLEFTNKRAILLDEVIYKFYKQYAKHFQKNIKNFEFSIIATGGFGRKELAPHSDIDILFLHTLKNKKNLKNLVKPILHTLWNLGLRVGYATRTPQECISYSKKELDVCTSILESRFIVGDKNIYENLMKQYKNKIVERYGKKFIKAIFLEREKRLNEIGDTRYLLEPNVKNGKGAIRDLQTLDWIGKFFYKINNLNDLTNYKILDKNSVESFIKAKKFFWSVRSHLHILSERPNEQLSFEFQNLIAKKLGYKKTEALSYVEKFMKEYFSTAKKVSDLIRIYCSFIEDKEKLHPGLKIKKSKEIEFENFIIKDKRIDFSKNFRFKNIFLNNCSSFFRILEIAQEKNLDIHPKAARLILDNIKRVEKKIKRNKEFLFSFIKILTSKNKTEKFLKLMSDLGLLGILIPDFKRISGQMQFGGFHTYTVDEHTLKAIGYINDIEMKKNLKENLLYSNIFSEIISTRILYIAMFFHDLGKGTGRDHSIVSSEIAKEFCSRIEMDQTEKNIIIWLIRNHLLMNKISQKRDIDDTNTIFEFGKKVESLEQLKLLFIFTVTDMKATGKTIWNNWNKYPLEKLFLKTRNLFLGSSINVNKKIIETVKSKLKKDRNLYPKKKIDNFLKVLPKEIYLNNDKKKIVKFLQIIQKSKQKTCIKIFQNKQKLATEILIYTKDKPGLLYKLSGAATISGFNLVEAKVSTLNNGMALDILWVRDLNGSMLDKLYHFSKLEKKMLKILSNDNSLEKEVENEREKNLKKNLFNINTKIFIDNDSSKKHTILEINTFDRIGLIYDVTKKLYELGLKISSAKILTMGKGANEIFYIQDFRGNKILSNKKINKLKTSIITLLKN